MPPSIRVAWMLQARGMASTPSVRCMGSSQSWSPLFADNGAWLLDTRGINKITWSAIDNPNQVTHSGYCARLACWKCSI